MDSDKITELNPCCLKQDHNLCISKEFRFEDDSSSDKVYERYRSPQQEISEKMGPIGPWATGNCDWNPRNGLTGIRPVVDHYSITRCSTHEWEQSNEAIFNENKKIIQQNINVESNAKDLMEQTHATVYRHHSYSTKMLKERTHEIHRLKMTLERAIRAHMDEISSLAEQRNRLMRAMSVLELPESIATECIERRSRRPDSELVRDCPEKELIEEISLISEIRNVLNKILAEVNTQQGLNRASREQLEKDWSDKKNSYEIDSVNSALNDMSLEKRFQPGATRLNDNQSTENQWESFTKQTLDNCEEIRQKSIKLRSNIDAILINAARDLRTKSDSVILAFHRRITRIDEARIKLENELTECLKRLAETESLIEKLNHELQDMDTPMNVAQTRMNNRNHRLNVENCRDRAHVGLLEEIRSIGEATLNISIAIKEAENARSNSIQTRTLLQRELILKRQALEIDKERCLFYRNHYPTTTALSGFV